MPSLISWARAHRSFGARRVALIALLAATTLPVTIASAATEIEQLAQSRLGLSRFSLERLSLPTTRTRTTFGLVIDGERMLLRLEPSTLRTNGFRVLVQDPDGSLREIQPPEPTTYRGVVEGRPGSLVGATIRDGQLTAVISLPGRPLTYVQPMSEVGGSERELHIVYRADAVAAVGGTCATDGPPVFVPPIHSDSPMGTAAAPLIADIAFDADHEFFQKNGSSTDSTVRDVEKVLTGVNVVYERDCGITHRISTIVVRSAEPDPYDSTAAGPLLDELRSEWNAGTLNNVERDMVHLLTGKNLNGGTVGIAYVGVVCNDASAYGLSESRFSSNGPFSWRTALTAHELGHNWNAVHCNGTNPCNIMCASIDGCNGVGLPNFEPMGQTAIRNYAASRNCLNTPVAVVEPTSVAAGIMLEAPRPSPFRDRARLSYALPRAGSVRLAVFDVAGHRIATLVDGVEGAGSHVVSWDARGAAGVAVKPGVMYVKLESAGAAVTRTLIRIR